MSSFKQHNFITVLYFFLSKLLPNNMLSLKVSAKMNGSYSTIAIDPLTYKFP